ncbi:MAG: hypothetical protein RL373_42 [Pseudomonadota bacterium]
MHCLHENQYIWDEYDAQGIFLTRVCDKCVDAKLSVYRPEILSGYDQSDVDEFIEPDGDFPSDRFILAESNSRNTQF